MSWFNVESKVVITLAPGLVHTAIGANGKIKSVNINENTANDSANPFGIVSANSINIELIDNEKLFNIRNISSPYYGYVKEGMKIEYYMSIDGGEFERAGIYYATSINSSSELGAINTVKISGADILQYIGNRPIGDIGIESNITVKQYLAKIFASAGLLEGEYVIDESLNKTVLYTYAVGSKYKDILNMIAQAFMCNIYVDRDGIIRCIDLSQLHLVTPTFEFSGSSNLMSCKIGTDINSNYNAVKVNYINPTLSDMTELIRVDNIAIPPGEYTLSSYKVNGQLFMIDYVKITSEDKTCDVEVIDIQATQSDISLTLNNNGGKGVIVSIIVIGACVNDNSAFVEKIVDGADINNLKYLELQSNMIQDKSHAEEYCTKLLNYITQPVPYVQLNTRNNPLLRLGTICTVKSAVLDSDIVGMVCAINLGISEVYTSEIKVLNIEAIT